MGPLMGSFPYYSHTTPIRIPKDMGMVWEAYHFRGSHCWGVPEKIPYRQAFVKMSFYISIHLEGLLNDLMGSMGLIYLPTTKQINYINVGKYTVRPTDPLGIGVKLISIRKN